MRKKIIILAALFCSILMFGTGCGKEKSTEYYLQPNEVNYFMLKENPTNLESLGAAINGTKDMIVALDGVESAYVLNSLASLGDITATNLTMDFNFNGKGDFSKLGDLASIKGLNSLTLAGINDFQDVSVFNSLTDLTKLTLKDQAIDDFTPLAQCKNLKTLSLSGEKINFSSLLALPIENIEVPIADNNWVALNLLKTNTAIATINSVNRETYNVNEDLNDEQKYYNFQFTDCIYLTGKKGEITQQNQAPTAINGNLVIAAPANLLQPRHYTDQLMLNTACGLDENTKEAPIFFPYIEEYNKENSQSTFLKLAGTPFMQEKFITAIDAKEAKNAVYVYAVDEGGNFTTDYNKGQLWIYAQLYNLADGICYEPALIYQSALGGEANAPNYQSEIIKVLDTYLQGFSVNP
ncbi:MAG: hypothetical protein RR992_00275 [Clostridiales bacterium]